MSRLSEYYKKTVVPKLMKELEFTNIMQVPKITKITLNMGVGEALTDRKIITNTVNELTQIVGQKAVATKAKKSIAGFKLREGWPVGCKVTLRSDKMYEFLDRLLSVALPRVRDFRGLSRKSFDKRGNYSLGIQEQIVFPEIKYDKIDAIRGLDVCITTTANNNKEGLALLQALNFPFKSA